MHDIVTNNFHLFVYTNSIIFTSDHQNQSSVSTHGMIKCMLHTRVYTPLFTYFLYMLSDSKSHTKLFKYVLLSNQMLTFLKLVNVYNIDDKTCGTTFPFV